MSSGMWRAPYALQDGPSCTGGALLHRRLQDSGPGQPCSAQGGLRSRTARAAAAVGGGQGSPQMDSNCDTIVCTKFLKKAENICMALRKDD